MLTHHRIRSNPPREIGMGVVRSGWLTVNVGTVASPAANRDSEQQQGCPL
jgi:hypothetical protein